MTLNNSAVLFIRHVHRISDRVAIRNTTYGSRYVRSLVKVFMEDAHNTDILTMLEKVCIFGDKFYVEE